MLKENNKIKGGDNMIKTKSISELMAEEVIVKEQGESDIYTITLNIPYYEEQEKMAEYGFEMVSGYDEYDAYYEELGYYHDELGCLNIKNRYKYQEHIYSITLYNKSSYEGEAYMILEESLEEAIKNSKELKEINTFYEQFNICPKFYPETMSEWLQIDFAEKLFDCEDIIEAYVRDGSVDIGEGYVLTYIDLEWEKYTVVKKILEDYLSYRGDKGLGVEKTILTDYLDLIFDEEDLVDFCEAHTNFKKTGDYQSVVNLIKKTVEEN